MTLKPYSSCLVLLDEAQHCNAKIGCPFWSEQNELFVHVFFLVTGFSWKILSFNYLWFVHLDICCSEVYLLFAHLVSYVCILIYRIFVARNYCLKIISTQTLLSGWYQFFARLMVRDIFWVFCLSLSVVICPSFIWIFSLFKTAGCTYFCGLMCYTTKRL